MRAVERLTGGPPLWRTRRGRVVLGLARRRRTVAAGLAVLGALGLVGSVRPPPGRTVAVLAAAHDLAGGARLRPADLATVRLPPSVVPSGAVRAAAAGRVLAAPMRRGEPLTDTRLLGPGLLSGYGAGLVAAPVRIADADAVALLHPGDRIDVLAAGAEGAEESGGVAGGARVVAGFVPVVVVPRTAGGVETGGRDGALVVVAVRPEVAGDLVGASAGSRLSVTIRSR